MSEKAKSLLARSGYAAGGKIDYIGPYKGATRKTDKAGHRGERELTPVKPRVEPKLGKPLKEKPLLRGSQFAKGGKAKKGK